MTDLEIHLSFDLVEERAKRSELALRIKQLLEDALDAIEIDAPEIAQRRIRAALETCKPEILK